MPRRHRPRLIWTTSLAVAAVLIARVQAAPLIAPTDPLPPDKQQQTFRLPPGFEIQLVASEPDIQKPMNLNFDTRGRLWVTHTTEYPFPAKDPDKARDGLTILSNIGADGRARKVQRFADKLNIPIGIVPLRGGREAIVWSVPYIWKLTDTDGDDKADKREILYGPFEVADTHGDQNGFTRGLDGWIYACHGYRNHSKVKLRGKGKVVVEMQSGHTYRFKPDGSAIEIFTHGQVNPFGLCFDPWGNIFTADCHSKPVTMLLRGAYYPSFGKPHDGLGFAPAMTNDNHGSTAIAGIAYYAADQFPKPYRDCLYVGNVVTNRVHRDVISWRGSTPWVDKPADFITCDDPWFRPVDIQLGPDGCLYIADFYNRIIGHYEVPLNHPGRDHHRGRIWRVVWKGNSTASSTLVQDASKAQTDRVLERLGDDNLTVRRNAAFTLMDRLSKSDADKLTASLWPKLFAAESSQESVVGMLWVLHHFNRLPLDSTDWFHAGGNRDLVRTHLARLLAEMRDHSALNAVDSLLSENDGQVHRAAVELMATHPSAANIPRLLEVLHTSKTHDPSLQHAARIALRNQLRDSQRLDAIGTLTLKAADLETLAHIALAVPTEAAALFTFDYIKQRDGKVNDLPKYLTHVAWHVPIARLDEVAAFVRKQYADDAFAQLALFESIHAGAHQRGVKAAADSAMGRWLADLVETTLDPARPQAAPMWANHPVQGLPASKSPWGVRHRASTDGHATAQFFDSIVHGEQLTGVLRSRAFAIPAKLSFWMCGHNGFPNTSPPPANHVRLKLAGTGQVIARQIPPRHDTARKYTWDLSKWKGRHGVLEIVDANTLAAYAWIGVGRFDPPVVCVTPLGVEDRDRRLAQVVRLVGAYRLKRMGPRLVDIAAQPSSSHVLRLAATDAAIQLGLLDQSKLRDAIVDQFRTAVAAAQRELALLLCRRRPGAALLVDVIAAGKASPRLLQDKQVQQGFGAVADAALQQRAAQLTRGLPTADQRIVQLIGQRAKAYTTANASADRGKTVFAKHCAACHRIGNEGAMIGPQLDGIGNRGLARLLEDVLDPSRNVDEAFRTTIIRTNDGDVITGLQVRKEGKTIVLADAQGKEQRVREADIASTRRSVLSPMPSNVAELIAETDFYDLMAYLLSQQTKPKR